MNAEKAIFALLTTDQRAIDAGLPAVVPADKITPMSDVPDNPTLPFITYFRVHAPPVFSMEGRSDYTMALMQVDVYASSYPSAKAIAQKVRDILSGYRGSIAGVTVQAIIFLGDGDVHDEKEEILVIEQRHVAMEFRVHVND